VVPTTPVARSPRRPAGTSRAGKAWCTPGTRRPCVHRPALRWKAGDGPPTWPPTQDRTVAEKRTLGIAFRALLRSPTAVAYRRGGVGSQVGNTARTGRRSKWAPGAETDHRASVTGGHGDRRSGLTGVQWVHREPPRNPRATPRNSYVGWACAPWRRTSQRLKGLP